jgi:hypothetical protein
MNPIQNAIIWLITKASADDERANALPENPFLAKLLREDAEAARKLANSLQPLSGL